MNPIEALYVDGEPVAATAFVVPDMHLSSARSAMTRHDFVLLLRVAEVVAHLGPAYGIFVDEMRDDHERFGGADELSEAGFPPIQRLVEHPAALASVLGEYLKEELLQRFTWDGSEPGLYWYHQTTSCRVEDDVIFLTGICYSRG